MEEAWLRGLKHSSLFTSQRTQLWRHLRVDFPVNICILYGIQGGERENHDGNN